MIAFLVGFLVPIIGVGLVLLMQYRDDQYDKRMARHQWCSGCDRHDVKGWDMGWTEDQGRFWCRKCRS